MLRTLACRVSGAGLGNGEGADYILYRQNNWPLCSGALLDDKTEMQQLPPFHPTAVKKRLANSLGGYLLRRGKKEEAASDEENKLPSP